MPSHCDTLHGFQLQGEIRLGYEFNEMNLFICKAQINYSAQMNMDLIQIFYELDPIQFICLQIPLTSKLVDV